MTRFNVLTPVKMGGTWHRPGAAVEIERKAEADRLMAIGAVEPRDGREADPEIPAANTPDPAAVKAAIREVIPTLDPDAFTKQGDKAPKVKVIEGLLSERFSGAAITAELVGEAWAEHQADATAAADKSGNGGAAGDATPNSNTGE